MSKLLKHLGIGNGVKKVPGCGASGEAFRSDRVRSYLVDQSPARLTSPPSGFVTPSNPVERIAPLADYDTDTANTTSSFSSILSAAESIEFPPPPTPWMQSLEAHNQAAEHEAVNANVRSARVDNDRGRGGAQQETETFDDFEDLDTVIILFQIK